MQFLGKGIMAPLMNHRRRESCGEISKDCQDTFFAAMEDPDSLVRDTVRQSMIEEVLSWLIS